MNYGFVIDNRRCIGCHACSTACKAENDVPLGVYRTWVKYVETGAYPDVKRHFQVTRCNHCANPPCVRICPVTAMYQREDGIVEFDASVCIGCKGCLQACPYDAIYIDPESGTAAKCHYCAHRTDIGLEPACVVVCPERAIISGDLEQPDSEISRHLRNHKVTVRKPEQGTAPNLFYIEGDAPSLHPTATPRVPESYMWADTIPLHEGERSTNQADTRPSSPLVRADSGTPIVRPDRAGMPAGGPIQIGGRVAEHMVQVGYNAQHRVPWHWPVPAYLVTKGVGAGLFGVLALGWLLGLFPFDAATAAAAGLVSLAFIGLTTLLLVFDLERPERFLRILTRPQWASWLTRGAFLLIAFTLVLGTWTSIEVAAWGGWIAADFAAAMRPGLLWLGLPLGVGTAIYTAFLFGQAEGRDLWQSPLLPVHLFIQAAMMGMASLLLMDLVFPLSDPIVSFASSLLTPILCLDLAVMLLGEFGMPHASEVAAQAAHLITHGRYREHFWVGSVLVGHLVPLLLLSASWGLGLAALCTVVGLYYFEEAFVMAPQEIPNS